MADAENVIHLQVRPIPPATVERLAETIDDEVRALLRQEAAAEGIAPDAVSVEIGEPFGEHEAIDLIFRYGPAALSITLKVIELLKRRHAVKELPRRRRATATRRPRNRLS